MHNTLAVDKTGNPYRSPAEIAGPELVSRIHDCDFRSRSLMQVVGLTGQFETLSLLSIVAYLEA